MRSRPLLRACVLALAALLAGSSAAHAHGALKRSRPAAGDTLTVAPRTLRLEFTEAPELAVSSVQLVDPRGAAVRLAPLRTAGDSTRIVLADVNERLGPGRYVVRWRIAGRDGHPVSGELAFVIAAPADTAIASPRPSAPAAPAPAPAGGFDSSSPLYLLIRWAHFLALVGLAGAMAFHHLVLPGARRRGLGEVVRGDADARALRLAFVTATLLAASALARLVAQWVVMRGAAVAPSAVPMSLLLHGTAWGRAWQLEAAAIAVLAAALLLARRAGTRGQGWAGAAVAVLVLAFVPALSGHAAVSGSTVAIALDAAHVVGAGGWMGGLFVLLVAGLPAARRGTVPDAERTGAMAALVDAFSPTALLCSALIVATGALAAWRNVESIPALWGSRYGQVLLWKLAWFAVAVVVGLYNWRRARPALARTGDERAIRRAMRAELAAGVLVLLVTAVLVAVPMPADLAAMR